MDHCPQNPTSLAGIIARTILAALTVSFVTGCATIRVTNPPRTATEQFLMSEAMSRAVDQLSVNGMRDRAVYVDPTFLSPSSAQMSQEQTFAMGEIRAKLLLAGARVVDRRETSQVTVEVRSQGIGVDFTDFLLGIPAIYIPAVSGVPIATPELAFFKRTKQRGFAGFAYVAYWNDTGEIIASSGPYIGRTSRDDFFFFGYHPDPIGDIAPALPSPGSSTKPSTRPTTSP